MPKFKKSLIICFVCLGFALFFSSIIYAQVGETKNLKDKKETFFDKHGSAIITGLFGLLAILLTARISYASGIKREKKDRQLGFDNFNSTLRLDEKSWTLEYEDTDSKVKSGIVVLKQDGCRIAGTVENKEESRKWNIEGAVSNRMACYVYTDSNNNIESFGAVVLKMTADGNRLEGEWFGHDSLTNRMAKGKVNLV